MKDIDEARHRLANWRKGLALMLSRDPLGPMPCHPDRARAELRSAIDAIVDSADPYDLLDACVALEGSLKRAAEPKPCRPASHVPEATPAPLFEGG